MKHNMHRREGDRPSPRAAQDPDFGEEIKFYRASEKPYGVFSNLFRRPITLEDRVFPTAEHAYQFGKARKKEVREWILSAPSPALVAMAGHGLYTWDIVPAWSRIKFERMRNVLHAKFSQHKDLRALLLSTGDARLVEAGRVDNAVNRTWGEINGKGKNILGVLLMELRAELRNNKLSKAENRRPELGKAVRRSKKHSCRSLRTNNRKNDSYAIRN
jgi:ribA/ribD-fused uncharacterized protein